MAVQGFVAAGYGHPGDHRPALWRLVTGILEITGRLVAVVLGLAFLIVGVILSATVIGALVGMPLAFFGILLILRGLF